MSLMFYYAPGACSLGVHIALEEAGADYKAVPVSLADGEQLKPEYRAINPRGRVPALVVGSTVITECIGIHSYIAGAYPAARLLPADPVKLGKALELLSFLASTVHIHYAQVFRGARFTDDQPAVEALRRDGPGRVRAALADIESRFAHGGPWLLGDDYSAADPYAYVFYRWTSRIGVDPTAYPAWTAQVERLLQRPATLAALRQEGLLETPPQRATA
ncbi:glutathione S-transferase family protein [Zavarzinia compransoris]|uniref:Glutathione S-transferase family protein n=1 Tax=Zavarzinia compransoris TaxID=1264899 RepID=A0A317DUB7_9PROT|nr:glutathione S-transferase N-terminal domain-containing protein [Zavarzinia compransoris]PWR18269.1 glutathione S-transferase family protein [Zavarzinia compransoris]TDP43675.1 glutathione S-transferase [Zavarzinia compransoris]